MPDAPSTTFGQRVRAAMDHARLDELQTASKAAIDPKTLDRYLGREDAPRTKAGVKGIARATGVDETWLELGTGQMSPTPVPNGRTDPHDFLNSDRAVPESAAILFVVESTNGEAVGYDMNTGRWVQVGPPGVVKAMPKAVSSALP